ncbi:unnamed protein product [Arctogadus glacialis]
MGKNRRIKRQEGDQETLCGDSSSPPGEQRPAQVSTSSQKKERLRQVVIRWMETNEEANDPDHGQTAPDHGQTAPDQGQTAPDHGQTAPDQGQTAPDHGQTAPDRGQTAPDRGQTAPDPGQTAPDHGQTAPDHGQTAPDQGQTAPDQGQTTQDQGQTAPDHGQTAPDQGQTTQDQGQTTQDQGQTAPDQGQTPDEPEPQHQGEGSGPLVAWLPQTADGPPRKDLAQVVGNLKVRVKGVRKLRVETATMDPGQTAQDPNQLPNVPGFNQHPPPGSMRRSLWAAVQAGAPSLARPPPDQGQTAPDQDQTANEPNPNTREKAQALWWPGCLRPQTGPPGRTWPRSRGT